MSPIAEAFRSAFQKGLSGFALKRSDPKAPVLFRLEPHEFYSMPSLNKSPFLVRGATIAGYLLPSILFVGFIVALERSLPLSLLFSDFVIRGLALSEAILLGAVAFEASRLFRGAYPHGKRYVFLAALTALVLATAAWPHAAILLACGIYAALHSATDAYARRARARARRLNLDPFALLATMGLVAVGAWGTPWAALALIGDLWSDNVLAGQLARSCLWAALGPSLVPVLLLHLAYDVAQFSGLAVMSIGLGTVFFILSNASQGAGSQPAPPPRDWIRTAFYAGFLPGLGVLMIATLSTWPQNIRWEQIFVWVMLLGWALRARGWNIKILISLAWAVLCVQAFIESL